MFARGYRPRGKDQHRTVVTFTRLTLGPEHMQRVILFDQMRRKRNRLMYKTAGLVSHGEAGQALSLAKEFVEHLRSIITGQPRLGM
jgi:hypothetical protein